MKKIARYTITSALPYANGPLHIGHVAGAYLPADIYVRYLRSKQEDVVFICGSDEHGAAITIQAKKEGTTPQAIVDKYHALLKKAFDGIDISFDFYHRTSSELHHKTSSEFFKILHEKGILEVRESEQYYDQKFHQFLADRYIKGTCPKCGHENAFGDQCENCGSSLSPTELIDPISALSGDKPILKTTKHWYLPLDKDQDWLREYIAEGVVDGKQHHNPKEWKKNVVGQCLSWLNEGLQARAVTRDLDWGVRVPLEDAEGKVLYVWLDAPIGYISSTIQWAIDNNKDWKPYWQSEDTKLLHFIGKDNIVFHCIIFPAILKNHGEFILPENVPANEFMNLEGDKISTSRNWAIWVHEFVDEFPGKVDVLRYVLTANMPETKDSEFTWLDFQARNNNELVAILGNFVNRVIVLLNKYFDGIISYDVSEIPLEDNKIPGLDLVWGTGGFVKEISDSIENYRFRDAQNRMMDVARQGNKYLTDEEPWKTFKDNPDHAGKVLSVSIQIIVNLAILCEPFLPKTSEDIRKIVIVDTDILLWANAGNPHLIPKGHQIGKPKFLFQKIEDEEIQKQIDKLKGSKSSVDKASIDKKQASKAEVSFDDFMKMDIRVGTIKTAMKVPKADKLLQLEVDLGNENRIIVSGIAEYYKAEEIIGKQVSVLVNLAPRKIRGILSQGMILMAEDQKGLKFISPSEDIENGAGIS